MDSISVPGEKPPTSLAPSLSAVRRAPTATTMKDTPSQSMAVPAAGLLLVARIATRAVATMARTTMSQKMLRKP
ncbi:hypothetical protein ABIB27_001304 [Arthrobacter sp. UYEF21]